MGKEPVPARGYSLLRCWNQCLAESFELQTMEFLVNAGEVTLKEGKFFFLRCCCCLLRTAWHP